MNGTTQLHVRAAEARRFAWRVREMIRTAAIVVRNAMLGGNVLAVSLLPQPRQFVNYVSECLFLFGTLRDQRGIPQRNVHEVFPTSNVERIALGGLRCDSTWLSPTSSYLSDIVSLCLLCQAVKPKVVFEIGTLTGYTTFHLALNSPEETKVYTLDLPREDRRTSLGTTLMDDSIIRARQSTERCHFHGTQVEHKVSQLFGDSARFDFSPFYGQVDLFFIDGSHSYEYVRSDTLNALKCCRNGSVIVWHDFGRAGVNGVTRYLLELSRIHQVSAVPGGSLAFMAVDRD